MLPGSVNFGWSRWREWFLFPTSMCLKKSHGSLDLGMFKRALTSFFWAAVGIRYCWFRLTERKVTRCIVEKIRFLAEPFRFG